MSTHHLLIRQYQGSHPNGNRATDLQPRNRQERETRTPAEILARYVPGKADPLKVLEVLIELFNTRHTAMEKTVSYKTRQERAFFLRRFFRDLREKAGFRPLPDPRNLGDRHIRTMVTVWQQAKLAPATVQTYFSFLRGLSAWLGKPGFIHTPDFYGMTPEQYQRRQNARHDKSWSTVGIDIEELIGRVCAYDRYAGASIRLIYAFGLRRKEAVMLRPHRCVVPFEETGLKLREVEADAYLRIKEGAKGGRLRFVPVDTPERIAALAVAQTVAQGQDAHMGDPERSLLDNLRRFDYVLKKFGITKKVLGVTVHGLRHEALIGHYERIAATAPPVRGGALVSREIDRAARLSTARLAGHNRIRASGAYLGSSVVMRSKTPESSSNAKPSGLASSDFPNDLDRDA
jgi:integrase